MRQFFLATDPARPPQPGEVVTLDRDESHHLLGVMRGADRRDWCLVDGRGHRLRARPTGGGGKLAELEILAVERDWREDDGPRLTLICAVVKGRHFDLVVEKAVELGAHRLVPLVTTRGVIEPGEGRRARWESLMRAALKQSGRCLLPVLDEPSGLAEALASCASDDLWFGAAPDERDTVADAPAAGARAGSGGRALFIGPEGGWTPDEARRLVAAGARPLDLGPFTLRTETAAIVGLAALRALARTDNAPGS